MDGIVDSIDTGTIDGIKVGIVDGILDDRGHRRYRRWREIFVDYVDLITRIM